VAYFVTRNGAQANTNDLRRHLQEKLPDYMLPAAIVELESFPLTPNAKIDRQALPASDPGRADSDPTLVNPRTETEAALARIWAQVLKLNEVSIHDNFFHL